MPFDNAEHHGHGHGRDEHGHKHIREIGEASMESAVLSARLNDQCIGCCVYQTGITALGRWAAMNVRQEMKKRGIENPIDMRDYTSEIIADMFPYIVEQTVNTLEELLTDDEDDDSPSASEGR